MSDADVIKRLKEGPPGTVGYCEAVDKLIELVERQEREIAKLRAKLEHPRVLFGSKKAPPR